MYRYIISQAVALLLALSAFSQSGNAELDMLINMALENNMGLKAVELQTEAAKANMGTAFDFDKTTVYYAHDQNNYAPNDKALNVFGVEQSFSFPTVYGARRKLYKSQWEQNKALYEIEKNKLAMDVSILYQQLVYIQHKESLYHQLDSLYQAFSTAGKRKFELGESSYLEKITSEAKSKQIHTALLQLKNQKSSSYTQLYALLQANDSININSKELSLLSLNGTSTNMNNYTQYNEATSQTYQMQHRVQNQGWLPDLNVGLFTGTSKGLGYHQNGIQVGLSIPLFFSGNVSKSKTSKLEMQSWQAKKTNREKRMEEFVIRKQSELNEHNEMIRYYTDNGKNLSKEIMKTAELSYKNGEIDFFQYIQSIESAISIEVDYLDSVLAYNKSYLEMYYFNYTE